MTAVEIMEKMKADAQAELDAAELAKLALEAKVKEVVDLEVTVESEAKARAEAAYKAGQDSIVLPDPTNPAAQYTQADMDKLAETVRGEKDAEWAPKVEAVEAEKAVLAGEIVAKDEEIAKMVADEASEDEKEAALHAEIKADLDAVEAKIVG